MRCNNKLLSIFSACLLMSGCQTSEVNDGKQSPQHNWKTKAERITSTDTIYFAANSAELTMSSKAKIKKLFAGANLDWPLYSRLYINKSENEAGENLMYLRLKSTRNYLEYIGVKDHRSAITILSPIESSKHCLKNPNAVGVNVDQYRIILPECPDWVKKPAGDFDLVQDNNFGCLSERNMAFMIAEPRDIYEAQPMEESDGVHNKLVVETYRKKPPETTLAGPLTIR